MKRFTNLAKSILLISQVALLFNFSTGQIFAKPISTEGKLPEGANLNCKASPPWSPNQGRTKFILSNCIWEESNGDLKGYTAIRYYSGKDYRGLFTSDPSQFCLIASHVQDITNTNVKGKEVFSKYFDCSKGVKVDVSLSWSKIEPKYNNDVFVVEGHFIRSIGIGAKYFQSEPIQYSSVKHN